ncbi:MAG: DEAD/DEAH box helicase, partial [Pseudomonadota bacterium]
MHDSKNFADLGISDKLLHALEEANFLEPTPIQTLAIPKILIGHDLLASAQTGTGKTASFTLPMIDILNEGTAKARMPRSVVLEPTRELAVQVSEQFDLLGTKHSLTHALLIGGVSYADQEKSIARGADVLIATPGRLQDHISRGKILLNDIKFLVLDEADRMLDMGFWPDVERLLSIMPKTKQTVLFSATLPKPIRDLANKFMHNPKEVFADPVSSTAATISQFLCRTTPRAKYEQCTKLLKDFPANRTLIFCNRKRDVGSLNERLQKSGFCANSLHGDMAQPDRLRCLQAFRDNEFPILVCSDVAARGLDIAAVELVINYDLPTKAEDYIHRIGRTGRNRQQGIAICIVTSSQDTELQAIEALIKQEISPYTLRSDDIHKQVAQP